MNKYDIYKLKSSLFYYLRVICHNFKQEKIIYFYDTNKPQNKDIEHCKYVDIDKVYALYPKTFSERLNMIMQLLHTTIANVGDTIEYSMPHDKCLMFRYILSSDDTKNKQLEEMLRILVEVGYIEARQGCLGEPQDYTFTPNGWSRVDTLWHYEKQDKVFIAMAFDWGNEKYHLGECRDSIEEAIRRANYAPVIISEKQHNNLIPEEILNQIQLSQFVVVDLTTQNNGAYYEAGIAKGMGKEVIFTCHKDDFHNIHFDTKQINTISWEDPQILIDDLYNRIKGTIGIRNII